MILKRFQELWDGFFVGGINTFNTGAESKQLTDVVDKDQTIVFEAVICHLSNGGQEGAGENILRCENEMKNDMPDKESVITVFTGILLDGASQFWI